MIRKWAVDWISGLRIIRSVDWTSKYECDTDMGKIIFWGDIINCVILATAKQIPVPKYSFEIYDVEI